MPRLFEPVELDATATVVVDTALLPSTIRTLPSPTRPPTPTLESALLILTVLPEASAIETLPPACVEPKTPPFWTVIILYISTVAQVLAGALEAVTLPLIVIV